MKNKNTCSFCGKKMEKEQVAIKGIDSYICSDCLDKAVELRNELRNDNREKKQSFNYTPKIIKEKLDEYIVGQENAKKILSVEIYNHYKRTSLKNKDIEKTNVLLIGSSGSGKTYLVKTLAKILDVPLYITDATEYTENGYKGKDIEEILSGLLYEADCDEQRAMKGIVYIDEIDKLATNDSNFNKLNKDVSGKGVQKTLLKLIEGHQYKIGNTYNIDSSNILFIFGGAFEGLEKNKNNNKKRRRIGFITENIEEISNNNSEINADDLIEYGFMKEFIGRIPLIAQLHGLNKEDMKKILTEVKHSILDQYKKLFELDGVKLVFSEDSIDYIAEEACKKNIGARGLKAILSKRMNDIMFKIPDLEIEEFKITKEFFID